MNNSSSHNQNSPQNPAPSSAAQNLADSMWAMLNKASSTLPLEVTQDLALKMVTVLAEVNGNSNAGLAPVQGAAPAQNPSAQGPSSHGLVPQAALPAPQAQPLPVEHAPVVYGAQTHQSAPRPTNTPRQSEYWDDLPEIITESQFESKSAIRTIPSNSYPSPNTPSAPAVGPFDQPPAQDYWTQLPTITPQSQLPQQPSTGSGSGVIGGYSSRAIAGRNTPPAPSAQPAPSGEFGFRESDTMYGLSNGDTAVTPPRDSQTGRLKPPPLKLPPVPPGPASLASPTPAPQAAPQGNRLSTTGVRPQTSQPRPASHPRPGDSSPSLGALGLGTPETGGTARFSDDDVQEKIVAALEATLIPSFSSIKVVVMNGEVVLKGRLDSDYEKKLAMQTVRRVNGVRKINDALQVDEDDAEEAVVRPARTKKSAPPQKKKKRKTEDYDDEDNGWIIKHRKHLSAAAVVLVLAGYFFWPFGDDGRPAVARDLVAVKGQLKYEEQSLSGANITFFAMRSDTEFDSPVMTTSVNDGAFQITSGKATKPGLRPGRYVIVVEYHNMQVTDDGEAVFGPNVLPKIYSKPETSPLKIEVAEDKPEIGLVHVTEPEQPAEMNL